MHCPFCRTPVEEGAADCPSCGGDTRLWVRSPDGAVYGPYTLQEVRNYAAEGRIVPSAVLQDARSQVFALAQLNVVAAVPGVTYPTYYGPQPATSSAMPCGVIAAVVAAIAVVIIPILAAILFPVFARARGKAQQASCLSNLKQLGLATVMYAADYNDIFPDASTWRDATLPYTKAPTIYECPTSGLGQQSYEMATPLSRVNQTWITNRPDCALLYDAGLPQGSGPHNGGGDVCYADAHVKWIVGSAFAGLPPPAISPPQAP